MHEYFYVWTFRKISLMESEIQSRKYFFFKLCIYVWEYKLDV